MGSLADIVLSFLNLLEAEGRALRLGVARVALFLVLLGVVAVLVLTGFGLVVWSGYLFLRLKAEPPLAALLDGCATLLIGGIFLWGARKIVR